MKNKTYMVVYSTITMEYSIAPLKNKIPKTLRLMFTGTYKECLEYINAEQ